MIRISMVKIEAEAHFYNGGQLSTRNDMKHTNPSHLTDGSNADSQALIVLLLIPLLCSFALSLSRNFFCSSLLIPFSVCSLSSFLRFSNLVFLSSAFSSSSNFLILSISDCRAAFTRFITSGRKCAFDTRKSGKRRKYVKSGRVET